MENAPRTLIEAVRYFADPEVALKHMVELRWPEGVHCPHCGRTDVRFIATRRIWECKEKHAKRQFSAKVGTIFEDSALPLDKWFVAIWLIANAKNGISSYELGRSLGITQKSAWHMNHRIRLAMKMGTFEKMKNEVEADETAVGGLAKNMHAHKRAARITGRGNTNKTVVLGIVERTTADSPSRIRAGVIQAADRKTLHGAITATVEAGSTLYTDAWRPYRGLKGYTHAIIDHSIGEYVNGRVSTNAVENFWSLLKRSIKGTYIAVEPFHLGRYVDEQVFRFNARKGNDADRFATLLSAVTGKRLQYKELIGNARIASAA